MIATLPQGLKGAEHRASQSVLADVILSFQDVRRPFVKADLNIDGGLGLSLTRRSSLPVVLLPLFSECIDAAGGIIDAVYGLQQASLEFRIVVVTDMPSFRELRPLGWAISHVQPELTWDDDFWFDYAQAELERIIEAFGCSYVIETSELGISAGSWSSLLSIASMGLDLPNISERSWPRDSVQVLHSSWRGWLNKVDDGISQHLVSVDGGGWTVDIVKNPESSMVTVQLGAGRTRTLTNAPNDLRVGWNIVQMRPLPDADSLPSDPLPGVMAIFDALSLGNCGILEIDGKTLFSFEERLPYVVQTNEVTESDVKAAYRRALSIWSS